VGSRDVSAAPVPEPVRTLGPDVWMIGGGTAVLAVGFRDHVVVVDAPPNAATVLERLATLAPGKPVRYVVPTHHHDDHAGGVHDYVRHGATVVTTAANRGYMERIGGDGTRVEVVDGPMRVFEEDARRLEIHAIGPGPHAEDMFIAWIPALGVLYQADLIDVDASGDTPPGTNNETTLHFASWLARQRWNVRMFAGTHGSLPTPRAFDALIAMPVLPLRR
jgi:glyoxylase-like metal-dependent hydrolase (beta-lactamase superfamily II)